MEELFDTIRRLTCDSRMIHLNTNIPQWQIAQVKNRLFLVPKSQNKDTCEWWLRLYHGDYEKADISLLKWAIEGKEIDIKGRTYK